MALQTKTFSVGDFTKGGVTNGYILDLILTEESTSVANNTSQISYTLQLRSGGSNRFASSYFYCKANVGGQEKTANPKITAAYNHTYTLITGSVTVSHNEDGSFALPWSASMWNGSTNSYAPYDTEFSGTMDLTTIPRANTVKATDADIGSVSTVTVKQNSSQFSHTVAYKFGSLTGYMDANGDSVSKAVKLTAVSIPFTVPESFYGQIPNDPFGVCTLTCVTYQGDTQIGEAQTAQFTVTAKESACKPTVTGTVVDVNEATLALTGNEKTLVMHRSTAHCTINAQAKNSASIAKMTVAGTVTTEATLDIPNVQTAAVEFKAVDSRGYPGTDTDEAVTVVDYIPLTNLASVSRDDPTSGKATVTLSGCYWVGNFGAADNSLTVVCRVNGGDPETAEPTLSFANGKYSGTIALSGLDYTEAHTVEVTVTDALTQVTKNLTVQKGIPVFDWGEGDFQFHVPVFLQSGLLAADCHRGYFTGDADEVTYNAVLRTQSGATHCPSDNGFLISLASSPGQVVLQIGCDYAGNNLQYRTKWYNAGSSHRNGWFEWRFF